MRDSAAWGRRCFLGLTTAGVGGTWKADLVVLVFCLTTAMAIGLLSRRRQVEPDSAMESCWWRRWPGVCC